MKVFDPNTLADFAGKDGAPVYVAVDGRVFDVTNSKRWKDGVHMKRHRAGRDLSADLQAAPHGPEMLDRYPQVGVLRSGLEAQEKTVPSSLARLLERHPRLRRHPHPMTVHFPIVFAFATAAFALLRLITGVESFGTTAFHCLFGLVLTAPVAAGTGLLAWRVNYGARPMRAVALKKRLTALLFMGALGTGAWQAATGNIFTSADGWVVLYLLLLLGLAALVSAIGWIGATLTFPLPED